MKIFKQLPMVLPFYDNISNQNQNRENLKDTHQFKLISPKNALLPFQIEIEPDKGAPEKWEIVKLGGAGIDITNNLSKIKIYEFADKKNAVYKGEALDFLRGTDTEPLNLPCGSYYTRFTFTDDSYFVSEVFTVTDRPLLDFIKIEFSNDTDLGPILYRDDFKQILFLDSFVSSFKPEVEERTNPDGYDNKIPIFQKLSLKCEFTAAVPDFIRIVLIALQMKDNVFVTLNDGSTGKIDRAIVDEGQLIENSGLYEMNLLFEYDVLYKKNCDSNRLPTNVTTW